MEEFFKNAICHLYLIEWQTQSYHRMVIATDTPLSQSRLRSFKRENKSVQYALKEKFESLDDVISRIKNEDGAYG